MTDLKRAGPVRDSLGAGSHGTGSNANTKVRPARIGSAKNAVAHRCRGKLITSLLLDWLIVPRAAMSYAPAAVAARLCSLTQRYSFMRLEIVSGIDLMTTMIPHQNHGV